MPLRTVPRWCLAVCWWCACAAEAAAQGGRPATDELAALRPADGLQVALYAAEPLVVNPAAIDVDTQGRVWVAEIQYYRKFADQPPRDKIKVLEDLDGDGRADRATVFAEGLYCPMSICVAGPRVYVATSPDLWLFEDRDGDLRADGPPQKLLTGFGGFNHDHGAHSLVLGPDHKWWMSHGDGGFDVTGTDGAGVNYRWGGVLRGELDGTRLELVAKNFRNPYEVCVSSFGEAFLSDNDNDGNQSARICWLLEGGNYGWFGHPPDRVPAGTPWGEGWHFRAHLPGFVPGTLVTGFGSPCGMCYYEGQAFGPARRNMPWHCDPGPREVRTYPHTAAGAGMQARLHVELSAAGDDYFRPSDICAAPDGSLLVADWYDGGVGGHAYNNPAQGRIFRLTAVGQAPARRELPGPYTTLADAALALASPNLATQFLAREALLAAGSAAEPVLAKLLDPGDANLAARALWVLDRLGGTSREHVVRQLASSEPRWRALAVRILRRHGEAHAAALLALAHDADPEVRRELLLWTTTRPTSEALPLLTAGALAFDGTDRYLLEAVNIAAQGRVKELVAALERQNAWTAPRLPLLQVLEPLRSIDHMAALLANSQLAGETQQAVLAQLGTVADPRAGRVVLLATQNAALEPALRAQGVELLGNRLANAWQSLDAEPATRAAAARWLADPAVRAAACDLLARRGWNEQMAAVAALAQDRSAPDADRVRAITALATLRSKDTTPIESLVECDRPAVAQAALEALATLQTWPVFKRLLTDTGRPPAARRAIVEQLAQTTAGALFLWRQVEQQVLPADLRARTLELAAAHADTQVRVLFEPLLPDAARHQTLGAALRPEQILSLTGDATRGEAIFYNSAAAQCQNCHAARGRGKSLGPDLSVIGRKYERAALLETILNPSFAMAPEYIPQLVETTAGQVFIGFLAEQTAEAIVLRDARNELVRVALVDVAAQVPQTKSLMPELVLRDVTAQDAADLLAFLTTLDAGVQPATRLRLAGPFDNGAGRGLHTAFAPEKSLATPDRLARFAGMADRPLGWDLAQAQEVAGLWAFDTVAHDLRLGFRGDRVTHYFLVYLDSPAAQSARLLIHSDDGVKLWHNGHLAHEHDVHRGLGAGADDVPVELLAGRNTLLVKVENLAGPGGLALAVSCPTPIEWRTE